MIRKQHSTLFKTQRAATSLPLRGSHLIHLAAEADALPVVAAHAVLAEGVVEAVGRNVLAPALAAENFNQNDPTIKPGNAHLNSEGRSISMADLLVLTGEESTVSRKVRNIFFIFKTT